MENQEINKTEYQEQGPRKGIVIIVITILLGTNGLLLWQFFEKKSNLDVANRKIMSTIAEKDALQVQLDQVRTEYEKVRADNADLQNQLTDKDIEIKAKVAEIQKLISLGGPAQIARAKAELAKLKEMNQVFITQIDSLNEVTAQLQSENQNLASTLTQEKSRNENLSAENSKLNSKVAAGSILKILNIQTEGIRYKSNGKEIVTNKAKQISKIRTKFLITENRVIDKGPMEIFLRVLNPDGTIMGSSSESITSNGREIQYTIKETVDYNNADLPVEVYWVKGSEFVKGKYNIEIYNAGTMIGKSMIELK